MEHLLIVLVFSISTILHQVSSSPAPVFECANQSGDQAWFNRAVNKCPKDHEWYHCLMVADKKTAPQYVEFCMQPQRIPKGEYVAFNYTKKSIVHRPCPEGTYQPVERKSNDSMAFKCLRQKSSCNLEGQQRCDDGSSESDRTCRCDYRAGYTLEAFAYGNPGKVSCVLPRVVDLACEKLDMCRTDQELNKYYQCVNKCPEGYHRPAGDGCHEIPDNMSSTKSETTTMSTIAITKEKDDSAVLKPDGEKISGAVLTATLVIVLVVILGAVSVMLFCFRKAILDFLIKNRKLDNVDGGTNHKILCCHFITYEQNFQIDFVENAAIGKKAQIVHNREGNNKKNKSRGNSEKERRGSEQEKLLECKENEASAGICTDGNIEETDLINAEPTLPKEAVSSSKGEEGMERENADLTVPGDTTGDKGVSRSGKAEEPKDADTTVPKETALTQGNAEVEREESSPDCNEYMKDMKQAALKKSWDVVDVPKDGSCFYHCVLELYPTKNGWDVSALRKKLKKYIESNSKHYKDFVSENWETFLSGIENNKWADHLEIKAMAEMLKVPITVHRLSQSGSELEVKEEIQVKDPRSEPMNIGHIVVNKEGFHFVALKPLVLTKS